MTIMNKELYEVLVAIHAAKDQAGAAAESLVHRDELEQFATRKDLDLLESRLRTEIHRAIGDRS